MSFIWILTSISPTIARNISKSEYKFMTKPDIFKPEKSVYPKNLKSWPEARVKAPGIDDRKRVNINNMDPFAIVDSRELSRTPAANFWGSLGISLVKSHSVTQNLLTIFSLHSYYLFFKKHEKI